MLWSIVARYSYLGMGSADGAVRSTDAPPRRVFVGVVVQVISSLGLVVPGIISAIAMSAGLMVVVVAVVLVEHGLREAAEFGHLRHLVVAGVVADGYVLEWLDI
jgi:hypothetical protein